MVGEYRQSAVGGRLLIDIHAVRVLPGGVDDKTTCGWEYEYGDLQDDADWENPRTAMPGTPRCEKCKVETGLWQRRQDH
jgi:hypothetical protein